MFSVVRDLLGQEERTSPVQLTTKQRMLDIITYSGVHNNTDKLGHGYASVILEPVLLQMSEVM